LCFEPAGQAQSPSYDFDGEQLRYRLYWMVFHVADSVSTAVRLDGERYRFTGKVATAGVASWFKKIEDYGYSIWNERTLCPEKTYISQREGNYARVRTYTYDITNRLVRYEKRNPRTGKVQLRLIRISALPFQDIVTSTFYFRRYGNFTVGAQTSFPLFAGGRFQEVRFLVVRKERIDTVFGEMEVFRVVPSENLSPEGVFKRKGKVVFWFTADSRHLPVKVSAEVAVGSVSAVLVDAKGKGFDLRKDYERRRKKTLMEKILSGVIGGE